MIVKLWVLVEVVGCCIVNRFEVSGVEIYFVQGYRCKLYKWNDEFIFFWCNDCGVKWIYYCFIFFYRNNN